jgi:Transposase DDE domain
MDRGYVDFVRLHVLHLAGAFFVTRAKSNMDAHRVYSAPSDRTIGIICDQTIALDGHYSASITPNICGASASGTQSPARRWRSSPTSLVGRDHLRALQKPLAEPAPAKAGVELFFKWIKQHLRIKRFFGTSENAVKTQIWIAVSVYVLVAIVKRRLNLDASLYTLLQILSVILFEKIPIYQALAQDDSKCSASQITNQLNLFAY